MNGGHLRILIVDDNEALVDNLEEILEDAGYAVLSAGSCAEARGKLESVALALVDLRLPDGDGIALAGELRAARPLLEVVLLTGHATVESAAEAVRAGAYAYLVKPVATENLLLTVEQAMRQIRLHTEKTELERRAHVAEKLAAVGTMTAGLSHEIRNPLNAASLQLQLLEKRVRKLPAEQQGPLLEPMLLVRDEIRRLDHVLNDFLNFARPLAFEPEPVDLGALIDAAAVLLRTEADQRGVTLAVELEGALTVAGDEGRLRQVLMNLVLNALQATPREGTVTVRARRGVEGVRVEVEDTGPGIPAELQARIFEPFFTTKASGSGLGLPIVHAIVLQHGGNITVDNTERGGARFAVILPAPPEGRPAG